ncbi:hypothetical protein B0H11DRAFT_2305430 [Mycena galericulata]|nr:hypothetical protein B0H11DRAFT_2305430 [Mycena galericulata]
MGRRKRETVRIPKESRKNLKMWAEGAREEILQPHLDEYSKAMEEGWRAERACLQRVCNEFHARVDWQLADHEEPVLTEFDPNKVIEKVTLEEDDEKAKRARIAVLNGRIRRWFKYRIRKLRKHRATTVLDPTKDPYAVLLATLSRMNSPPKARQAYQQLMRESYTEKIAPEVKEEWEKFLRENPDIDPKQKPKGGFRAQVARDVFKKLPASEQLALGKRATDEAKEKRAAYVKFLKDPASTLPADRQKCIDAVPGFMGPILAGLQEYTGMQCLLVMGGPIPKYGGEIRTVHVSYGRNKTAAAQSLPQWDKDRFNRNVLGFMKEYCSTAFTEQDCSENALPDAGDLSKAKYTIARPDDGASGSDSDSDSDSSSDSSSSDSESDSDLDDEKEDSHSRKKRKLDNAPDSGKTKRQSHSKRDAATSAAAASPAARTAPAAPPSADAIWRDEDGRTYMEARDANLARNKRMAEEFRAQMVADGLMPPPKAPSVRRARVPKVRTEPTRKSTRQTGGAGSREEGAMEVDPPSPEVSGTSGEDRIEIDAPLNDVGATSSTAKVAGPGLSAPPASDSAQHGSPPALTTADTADTSNVSTSAATGPTPTATAPPDSTGTISTASALASTQAAPDAPPTHVPAAPTISAASAPSSTQAAPDTPPTPVPLAPTISTASVPAATQPDPDSAPSAPRPLRARTESASVMRPPCPAKAAAWFVDAHAAMTRQDLGCHFDGLVAAWTRLEAASKYEQGPTNLPSKGRPKQVGTWISSARGTRGTADPKVLDPAKYAVEWQEWWNSLQPEWRKKDADGMWSTTGGYGKDGKEWGPLYQWGVNGTLSLLASLYFWGSAIRGDSDLEMAWEVAVVDVSWMLEGMALYYEKFNPTDFGIDSEGRLPMAPVVATLLFAIVPSGRMFGDRVAGKDRKYLANQTFTASYPVLSRTSRAASILLWVLVFGCKFTESYFYLELMQSE